MNYEEGVFPELNQRIDEICSPYAFPRNPPGGVNPPMFYPPFKSGGVLFLGINPSLNERERPKFDATFPEVFAPGHRFSQSEINRLVDFQKRQHGSHSLHDEQIPPEHSFFKVVLRTASRIPAISRLGLIQYYDLFPIRCTAQSEFEAQLKVWGANDNELVGRFRSLFSDLVKAVRPRFLWIANKGAGVKLLKNEWGIDPHDQSALIKAMPKGFRASFFPATVSDRVGIPILLTSQLSGGYNNLTSEGMSAISAHIDSVIG